jgi:thiol-disulfide isomerase/thioredoxin
VGPRTRRALIAVAALAGVAAFVVFGLASSAGQARLAPQLPHERLGGPPVTLAGLLAHSGGRPTAVVFWASWCGPCGEEAPALERFSTSPAGAGRIVGVDWSDALPGARSFIRRYAWTFPTVRDADGTVGYAYRIRGLPTTFVLDGHGHIRATLRGPQNVATLEHALAGVGTS